MSKNDNKPVSESEVIKTPLLPEFSPQEVKTEELQIPETKELQELSAPPKPDPIDYPVVKSSDGTLLMQTEKPKKFTPIASGKPLPSVPQSGSTEIRDPWKDILYGSPTRPQKSDSAEEKASEVPPQKVKDERRKFRAEIMGVKTGGPLILLPAGIHFTKSIKWKVQDFFFKRNMEKLWDSHFAVITEKDIKFLILLWRDILLDPQKMSRHDRLFIAESQSEKIQTNKSYLKNMCKLGLVTSLMVSERIVYRANISRGEFIRALSSGLESVNSNPKNEKILGYIDLIMKCYDFERGCIVIPQ
ncbi:MAG: hypothetical protein HOC71_09075 [Candidatus Latescibacteria bacterium]|nr:hypothetical protein [Candidatus Latescibacterota bacterium]